ncbi:hypothetical protein GOBAR_AA15117 [Gossypium barbadense]|uniref:Uncharacterized protein n=1 Tax=Gossypium barbadense TaxID=3634 RepID=A0A2P5XQC5_GOSBA|nr:hypothetical protein GOBAR_AA15117 [Gossypium barbadense]
MRRVGAAGKVRLGILLCASSPKRSTHCAELGQHQHSDHGRHLTYFGHPRFRLSDPKYYTCTNVVLWRKPAILVYLPKNTLASVLFVYAIPSVFDSNCVA